MQLVFQILIQSSHQGQLILAKLCYRGSDLHQLYKYITSIHVTVDSNNEGHLFTLLQDKRHVNGQLQWRRGKKRLAIGHLSKKFL